MKGQNILFLPLPKITKPSFPISHLWYHLESSSQPKSLPPTRTIVSQVLFPLSLSESIEKLASSPFPRLRATQAQQTHLATIICRDGRKPPNRFSRRMNTSLFCKNLSVDSLCYSSPTASAESKSRRKNTGRFWLAFLHLVKVNFSIVALKGVPRKTPANGFGLPARCPVHP